MNDRRYIIFDEEIVAADEPIAPAESRGLMYGDGVFETLRIYHGQTFFLSEHLQRLSRGLNYLGIQKPHRLEIQQLNAMIFNLLKKQQLLEHDAIVRLQVWRDGKRGYMPNGQSEAHFSITASACPGTFSHPQLVTVDHRRIPSESMPSDFKFTIGINYILAAREASEKGGDDALMTTTKDFISETTIANIFWIKDRTIFTPSEDCDLIPGITRDILMQLIDQHKNWELRKGRYRLEHLRGAESAWICNSVRELLPVKSVDNEAFNEEHTLVEELKAQFDRFRDANLQPLKES